MKEETCKDIVNQAFKNRFKAIKTLYDAYCEGEEDTEDGNIHEYGLSFDYVPSHTFTGQRVGYFRFQISWGGPSEEFRFYVTDGFKPYKIQFWYLDWFDGACKNLTGKKFEYMADFFTEFLGDSDHLNHVVQQSL